MSASLSSDDSVKSCTEAFLTMQMLSLSTGDVHMAAMADTLTRINSAIHHMCTQMTEREVAAEARDRKLVDLLSALVGGGRPAVGPALSTAEEFVKSNNVRGKWEHVCVT